MQRLRRRFGNRDVIRCLDLVLHAGDLVALRGPNGSGKSTVLRCIAGTLAPTSGFVTIGGHPAGTVGARELLGASLGQERSFYLRLTGRMNLEFFARLRGMGRRAASLRVAKLAEELELGEMLSQRVDRYSGGMIQQLAFARALLGDPVQVILDEPTRSLDAEALQRFWAALDRRPDTAVLIATHREEDFRRCRRYIDLPA